MRAASAYDDLRVELLRRLELVGLDESVLDLYPIELSGGMKQRVVMVLSTLLDPSLLIADELTSALDVSSQKAVSQLLVEFRDRGFVKSVILITHDLAVLYQIADTILVMYAGKLAEKAPAETIVHEPRHPYTRLLVSSLPEVGVTYASTRLSGIPGRPPSLLDPPTGCRFRDRCPLAVSEVRAGAAVRGARARALASPAGRPDGMLTLERVSKTYRTGTLGGKLLPAVRDVSFGVRAGEVVSLIGESGSGKSTIGKLILRLSPATEGVVSFDGVDVSTLERGALKGYYRRVQGVFQDPFSSYNPIFKADRVLATLKSGFYPRTGRAEWDAKVEEALHAVSLNPADVLGKYPHQLSGGQLQRLLVARALLLDLELLVADEIISMLDASTRIDVLNLLGDLKTRGLAILFITHDLSLGHYLSDRTVILRRGRIVELGSTERVFSNPLHPYTKMLLASVPQLTRKWGDEDEPVAAGLDAAGELVEVEDDHLVAVEEEVR